MTLSFPSDPINGAVSGEYTYDATKTAWRKNAALPVSVTHSDVAPSNPRAGDQWWKSNEGTLFTYYNDGTSSQWVESTNVVANVEPNPIPAGAMMAWGSDVIPANWLLCDGSAVSRYTYASLFAIIGTQYGSGDGSTTFNLPNIKGRTIVGKDAAQTEFDVLGEIGGAKTHTLTEAEIPSHTHTQVAHSHTFSGTTSNAGSHNHAIYVDSTQLRYINTSASQSSGMGGLAGIAGGADNLRTGTNGDHNHTYSGTTSSTTATNQNTGGGGAHNNLQPYIVLNYIIKFSAGETPGDSQLAVRVGAVEVANNDTPTSQNYIINGAFDFWQRGTSFSNPSSPTYQADRFITFQDGTSVTRSISQQTFTPGTSPITGTEASYYLRYSTTVLGTTTYQAIQNRIEDVRTLAGQTATFSFYAKADAAKTISLNIQQNFGGGGSTSVVVNNSTSYFVSTSWQRFTTTVTLPSLVGKTIGTNSFLQVGLEFGSQLLTLDLCGWQFEKGPYATPFRRNSSSIQEELASCQRYYQRISQTNYESLFGFGIQTTTTAGNVIVNLPVALRIPPTSVVLSNVKVGDQTAWANPATLNTFDRSTTNALSLTLTYASQGASLRPLFIQGTGTAPYNSYIEVSAEL